MDQVQPHTAFEYISTDIVPTGLDPLGQIQGGQLWVRGTFFEQYVSTALLMSKDGYRMSSFRELSGPERPCDCMMLAQRLKKVTRWTDGTTEHFQHCQGNVGFASSVSFDFSSPSVDGITLRFLLLLGDGKEVVDCGLVLQACGTDKYRRIGIFVISREGELNAEEWNTQIGEMTLV